MCLVFALTCAPRRAIAVRDFFQRPIEVHKALEIDATKANRVAQHLRSALHPLMN